MVRARFARAHAAFCCVRACARVRAPRMRAQRARGRWATDAWRHSCSSIITQLSPCTHISFSPISSRHRVHVIHVAWVALLSSCLGPVLCRLSFSGCDIVLFTTFAHLVVVSVVAWFIIIISAAAVHICRSAFPMPSFHSHRTRMPHCARVAFHAAFSHAPFASAVRLPPPTTYHPYIFHVPAVISARAVVTCLNHILCLHYFALYTAMVRFATFRGSLLWFFPVTTCRAVFSMPAVYHRCTLPPPLRFTLLTYVRRLYAAPPLCGSSRRLLLPRCCLVPLYTPFAPAAVASRPLQVCQPTTDEYRFLVAPRVDGAQRIYLIIPSCLRLYKFAVRHCTRATPLCWLVLGATRGISPRRAALATCCLCQRATAFTHFTHTPHRFWRYVCCHTTHLRARCLAGCARCRVTLYMVLYHACLYIWLGWLVPVLYDNRCHTLPV